MKLIMILMLSYLAASCSHNFIRSEVVTTSEIKSKTFNQAVRKDFIIMKGQGEFCDYEHTELSDIRTFSKANPPSLDKENNLLFAFGEATCKDKSKELKQVTRTWNSVHFLGVIKIANSSSSDSDEIETNDPQYDSSFSEQRNPKQPKKGEVTFIVGDDSVTEDFEHDFKDQSYRYGIAKVPLPKILRKELTKRLEAKDSKQVLMRVKYKSATMSYLFTPDLFKTTCESLIEGEEDSEEHCKPDQIPLDRE